MNKLLLICSTAALIYGDFAFGMDSADEMDWELTVSNSEQKEIQELKQQLLDC